MTYAYATSALSVFQIYMIILYIYKKINYKKHFVSAMTVTVSRSMVGIKMAINTAIMAITTSSSINVKPFIMFQNRH